MKELQTSAREAIVLLRAMIGEVCLNVEEEETEICSLFNSLQVGQVWEQEQDGGFLLKGRKRKGERERERQTLTAAYSVTLHHLTCSWFLYLFTQ